MKYTIPFICAALTGTSAFAQQSLSQPISEGSEHLVSYPVSEVFFAFDSAELKPMWAELMLLPITAWAKEHPSGTIVLDGNTDPIGAATYNIRLSARRAESVRDKLIEMGVDGDRVVMALYGEYGLQRTTYALDRRVTIWTTYDPLYAIIDSSLVRGKAVLWSKPVTYAELHPSASQVATR
jgi:outer membrane protein OmpA-like peptidoglycan-associated protein